MNRRLLSIVLSGALVGAACGARLDKTARAQAPDAALHTGVGQTDCNSAQNAHTILMSKVFALVGSSEIYDECGTKIEQQHPEVPDISYALGLATKQNTVNRFPPQVAPPGYQTGMFCKWKTEFGDAVTKPGAIYSNVPATAFSEHMIEHAAVKGCGWHFTDSSVTGATQTTFNAELAK